MRIFRDFVIVGNGPAGLYASEILRRMSREGIAVISSEPVPAYSRCVLPEVLKGKREEKSLLLKEKRWYEDSGIDLFTGSVAVEIDVEEKSVRTAGGDEISYGRLLVATGADPLVPAIKGINSGGVFTFRKIEDLWRIQNYLEENSRVVIVGGGFTGLKVAEALIHRGNSVTILEMLPRLLPRMLDEPAAALLERHMERNGVRLITGTGAREVLSREGRVCGIVTVSGDVLEADMLIMAVGVRPCTGPLKGRLETRAGILVDDCMRTSAEGVFAAGDVTEARDFFSGNIMHNPIWPNATAQARIAALNMLGYSFRYEGGLARNSVKIFGLPILVGGMTRGAGDSPEIVEAWDEKECVYRKLIYSARGRLSGFIMLGRFENAGRQLSLIRKTMDFWPGNNIYPVSGFTRMLGGLANEI